MEKKSTKNDRYTISAIDKALDVIEALAEHDSLNLIELAEMLSKPKSSVYRIILTLENRGYITRSEETGKYTLGYKQLTLTRNLLEKNSLRNCALPEMRWLSDKYAETVNLGVLSGGKVLYMEMIEGKHSLRMNESIGSTSPFHATAIGKTIAAFSSEEKVESLLALNPLQKITPNTIVDVDLFKKELCLIRERGYAVDDQEVVLGARCVAAPIFNLSGKVEAAISISGAIHRYPEEKIPEIAEDVKEKANNISAKLGFTGKISV